MSDNRKDSIEYDVQNKAMAPEAEEQNLRTNQLLSVLNTIEFDTAALQHNLEQYCKDRQENWVSKINTGADAFWSSAQSDAFLKTVGITGDKDDLRKISIFSSIHQSLYIDEMKENVESVNKVQSQLQDACGEEVSRRLEDLGQTLCSIEGALRRLEDYYANALLVRAGYADPYDDPVGVATVEKACCTLVASIPRQLHELRREVYFYQEVYLPLLQG